MIARPLSALALAAAVALPAVAGAQAGSPPAGQPQAQGRENGTGEAMMRRREARRLQALHDVLEIRPDQESAFQAFATALQPQHFEQPPEAAPPQQDMGALTTPERLDRVARMMADHETRRRARFERISGAVRTLYAALSPEQKRAFDALPALAGPGFGLGGHMDHGGHMMAGGMHGPSPGE
ncbi:MAG TPA: Spy/CpxP family protein refolding chaperone [Caulobacteraceae bacterium]|jgi:hypothetical protein|nr:Spy/CpxP family protein refolding chaperone [Caulobacteraceae bacterium]